MSDRVVQLREAARKALLLRRSLSIPRDQPINVFDIATSVGVEIRFMDLPSLEGMFYRGPDPKIILPSLKHRSRGRVSFSCAHELGHFQLGHGTRVDEYLAETDGRTQKPDEEIAADTFASTVLMPRPAVLNRFAIRGWAPETATPLQLYWVAIELDVGYMTLLKHIRYGLGMADAAWLKARTRVTPKALRQEITQQSDIRRVVLVDRHWPLSLPIDLEVGDCIALPDGIGTTVSPVFADKSTRQGWQIFTAQTVGESQLSIEGVGRAIRIARADHCGFWRYRFMEESEDS